MHEIRSRGFCLCVLIVAFTWGRFRRVFLDLEALVLAYVGKKKVEERVDPSRMS